METQIKAVATTVALGGFVVALVASLLAGNPPFQTLFNAVVALFACHLVGTAVGAALLRAAEDHLKDYKLSHPIPSLSGRSSHTPHAAQADASAKDDAESL